MLEIGTHVTRHRRLTPIHTYDMLRCELQRKKVDYMASMVTLYTFWIYQEEYRQYIIKKWLIMSTRAIIVKL